MTKLKNIFNDILNGWSGLYMAIYGAVSFVLGLCTATLNCYIDLSTIQNLFEEFFDLFALSSFYLCGIATLLSLIVLIASQIKITKSIKIKVGITILIILLFYLFKYGNNFLDFRGSGAGIVSIFYFLLGAPIILIFFIIPIFVLMRLDIKHKIQSPRYNFENKYIQSFFIIYFLSNWIGCLI